MAEPISVDLRKRIVRAYEDGNASYEAIAERVAVGRATVSRLLRRRRERGDVAPDGHGGGQPPKIPPEQYAALRDLVAERPASTAVQLCHGWPARYGVSVSRSAMLRA